MIQVMEMKHTAPYDGCSQERQYYVLDVNEGKVVKGYNVNYYGTSGGKMYPDLTMEQLQYLYDIGMEGFMQYPTEKIRHLGSIQLFDMETGDSIYDCIHTNWWPKVYNIVNGYLPRLDQRWMCSECGELVKEQPLHVSGSQGVGGVAINIMGWMCESCHMVEEEQMCGLSEN